MAPLMAQMQAQQVHIAALLAGPVGGGGGGGGGGGHGPAALTYAETWVPGTLVTADGHATMTQAELLDVNITSDAYIIAAEAMVAATTRRATVAHGGPQKVSKQHFESNIDGEQVAIFSKSVDMRALPEMTRNSRFMSAPNRALLFDLNGPVADWSNLISEGLKMASNPKPNPEHPMLHVLAQMVGTEVFGLRYINHERLSQYLEFDVAGMDAQDFLELFTPKTLFSSPRSKDVYLLRVQQLTILVAAFENFENCISIFRTSDARGMFTDLSARLRVLHSQGLEVDYLQFVVHTALETIGKRLEKETQSPMNNFDHTSSAAWRVEIINVLSAALHSDVCSLTHQTTTLHMRSLVPDDYLSAPKRGAKKQKKSTSESESEEDTSRSAKKAKGKASSSSKSRGVPGVCGVVGYTLGQCCR